MVCCFAQDIYANTYFLFLLYVVAHCITIVIKSGIRTHNTWTLQLTGFVLYPFVLSLCISIYFVLLSFYLSISFKICRCQIYLKTIFGNRGGGGGGGTHRRTGPAFFAPPAGLGADIFGALCVCSSRKPNPPK